MNILLDRFTRLNESVNPELLREDELTRLEDAVLDDETGKPKKRGGFARYNTNQVDSTDSVKSLHEVISSNGTNYLLAGINGKLRKSTSGTGSWSDVTSKGTPPYRMQPFINEFIFTDGSAAPFVVTGDSLGDVFDLEITPMDVSSVETGHASGGSLEANATYMWVFCYVTAEGELSPPSQPITHRISLGTASTTDATYRRVGFKGITASPDTRVVAIRIFRTQKNGSNIYYFHSQIANEDTNWLDQKDDNYLGSEGFDYINCPSASKYLAVHKERVWHGYITRNVENFIMPALSVTAGAGFNATEGGLTVAMTAGYGFQLGISPYVGTLPAGTYQYRIEFVDSEGFRSDYVESNSITIDGTAAESGVQFLNIPFLMGNDQIVRANVYRTDDSGATWVFVFSYDPNYAYTYAALDSYLDEGLADGDAYVTNVESETTKTGIAFSEIGQAAHYPLENLRNVYPDDGDEITGIFDDTDGLVVFKKNSICKIFTNGSPNGWRIVKLLENIGCNEPNSIAKQGNDYYFVHYSKIYKLNTSGGYEDIGQTIKDTLSTLVTSYVDTFKAATITKRYYVLSIYGSPYPNLGQYLFVWDLMLKTWYKFNLEYASLVLGVKQHGGTTGTLLLANADYILNYGSGSSDNTTGSAVDIVPFIQSKTYKFQDAFTLARLRKIKFNYQKLDNETLTIKVVNPDSLVTNTFTDTTNATNSTDWKEFEDGTKDTDSLKVTPKLYFQIYGAGLTEFGSLRQDYRVINRGKASA